MNAELEERFLAARRAVIARRFSGLNEMQRRAVMTTEGPLLLLAGAGSGKTTVLINRIANLIAFGEGSDSREIPDYITEDDVAFLESYLETGDESMQSRAEALSALRPAAPWSIIAITFTNKAANELKERLERMLGPEALDVWAMTFHSACCRILRRDIDRLEGYSSSFTIYDSSDSERVIKDVLRDFQMDEKAFPPRLALSVISRAKDKMQSPAEFDKTAAVAGDYRMEKISQIYAEYQSRLHAAPHGNGFSQRLSADRRRRNQCAHPERHQRSQCSVHRRNRPRRNHRRSRAGDHAADIANHVVAKRTHTVRIPQQPQRIRRLRHFPRRHRMKRRLRTGRYRHADDIKHNANGHNANQNQKRYRHLRISQQPGRNERHRRRNDHRNEKNE